MTCVPNKCPNLAPHLSETHLLPDISECSQFAQDLKVFEPLRMGVGPELSSYVFHLVRFNFCLLSLGMFATIVLTVASSLKTNILWARCLSEDGAKQLRLHPSKAGTTMTPI